jgi:hypothetical protein
MKFTLHMNSVLVGVVLSLVVVGAAGAAYVGGSNLITTRPMPIPAQMSWVEEAVPLVVPPGRVFVVTQLGYKRTNEFETWFPTSVELFFNGELVVVNHSQTRIYPGIVAPSGTTVSVVAVQGIGPDPSSTHDGIAFGYFSDLTPAPPP